MAFSEGVTNKWLVGKMETHNMEIVSELFALADKYAREAEAHAKVERRGAPEETPAHDGPKPNAKANKRKAAAILAMEGHPRQPPRGNLTGGDRKPAPPRQDGDKWCELHSTDRHDLTECRLVKDLTARGQRGRDDRQHDDRDDQDDRDQAGTCGAGLGFQEPQHAVATIFGGASSPLSRRRAKLHWREVCAASPAPGGSQPLKWPSTPLTFDRSDHP